MTKGKKSRMTDDRFQLLDDMGFKWSVTMPPKATTTTTQAQAETMEPKAEPTDVTLEAEEPEPTNTVVDGSESATLLETTPDPAEV
jgi:hypothetical protein